MKKFASCGLVVLISLLALSLPFRADGAPRFALKVDRKVLFTGEQFTATATSKVDCDWILEWNGARESGDTRRLVATFTAPTVTKITKLPLKARCFYAAPARETRPTAKARAGTSQQVLVTVPPSWTKTILITVLPAGSGGVSPPGVDGTGGDLPNTGGPSRWLLIVGLGAVLAGSVVVRGSARRRAD